jgi:hypothetical protein
MKTVATPNRPDETASDGANALRAHLHQVWSAVASGWAEHADHAGARGAGVLGFPDRAGLMRWASSPAYREIAVHRPAASDGVALTLAPFDEPPEAPDKVCSRATSQSGSQGVMVRS